MKKMMMIEAPLICAHCPFFYDCCFCMRFEFCTEKDVEVEDEK
jgi:hypothetical protein